MGSLGKVYMELFLLFIYFFCKFKVLLKLKNIKNKKDHLGNKYLQVVHPLDIFLNIKLCELS